MLENVCEFLSNKKFSIITIFTHKNVNDKYAHCLVDASSLPRNINFAIFSKEILSMKFIEIN